MLRERRWDLVRLALAIIVFAWVAIIGLSQGLADWWSGADSGNVFLDGPAGFVRALHSVLEFGWLGDGLGVHVVMWFVAATVAIAALRPFLSTVRLPVLAGSMAATGIALELMQEAWTLRNASVRDVIGNLVGVGAAATWSMRAAWHSERSSDLPRGVVQ